MRRLFWKLWYCFGRKPTTKAEVMRWYGRINGIEIISIRTRKLQGEMLMGLPRRVTHN